MYLINLDCYVCTLPPAVSQDVVRSDGTHVRHYADGSVKVLSAAAAPLQPLQPQQPQHGSTAISAADARSVPTILRSSR
jgi:hypothetical protein